MDEERPSDFGDFLTGVCLISLWLALIIAIQVA